MESHRQHWSFGLHDYFKAFLQSMETQVEYTQFPLENYPIILQFM